MNIAFPALLIFLLILPGILFRYAYRKGFWRSPVRLHSVSEEFTQGVFLALIIHFIALLVIKTLFKVEIRFDSLLLLLTGWPGLSDQYIIDYIDSAVTVPYAVLGYAIAINAISYLLGFGLHWFVRRCRLDLRYDRLRFDNEWHYLFSGEAVVFTIPRKDRKFTIIRELLHEYRDAVTVITCIVNLHDASYFYLGVLWDYYFDRSGQLDKILLSTAQMRKIDLVPDNGEDAEETFQNVRGDNLILKYENIINLSVEYILLSE